MAALKKRLTCPNCGKQFPAWREKKFCSERCAAADRKRRQRAAGDAGLSRDVTGKNPSPVLPYLTTEKSLQASEQNQGLGEGLSRDEPWRAPLFWKAVNEVTWKCMAKEGGPAVGWVIQIEGHGWFGRVRDERGEWSFGPASLFRCREAVAARLRNEEFARRDGEAAWRGDCGVLLGLGRSAA